MAIDTPAKRKSVINNGVPAIALMPVPDGLIQAVDRRRIADFYSLGAQIIAHNFWVPDRRDTVAAWTGDARTTTPTWIQDQIPDEIFVQDKRSSTDWVQDEDSDTDWKEETEVPTE